MAVTKYTGSCGEYYANGSLTADQKKANVIYIGKYLLGKGWSLQAIAGLCGNIESECGFNPGGKEVGGSGYGLIQWTPGSIHSDWCTANGYSDATTMDANLAHIQSEAENNTSWYKKDSYTESYLEFTTSNKSPYYLACVFAWNRERSGVVLWGFHRGESYKRVPPHNNSYCKKVSYDTNCETKCKAWAYCYKNHFGNSKYVAQQERNRQELRDTRGGQAEKWYKVLWTELYARLDDTDTSVLTSPYWKSRSYGGLNYNSAVEKWPSDSDNNGIPNAMEGATAVDWSNIQGTYTTLPNCTSWAWGRAYELMGEAPPEFRGDAGFWWNSYDELNANNALVNKGYIKSETTPSLGAIACWQDPDTPRSMGHVAIVEAINDDGTIIISESGYRTWVWRPSYFNVKTITAGSDYKTSSNTYKFKGYISLPSFGGGLPTINSFELIESRTEEADFQICITENGGSISRSYYTLNTGITGDLSLIDGNNAFTIRDLVPNTDYAISVTLEASGGSVTSNTVLFKTKQDYPDPIKNITINAKKHHEKSSFTINITPPDRWGYWKDTAGNDYGYRVFLVDNCLLSDYYDMKNENIQNFFKEKPADYSIGHAHNFQVGVSTWVADHRIADAEEQKVFALEGHKEYPICSNSICLKELDEMSDNYYLLTKNILSKPEINRLQAYDRKTGKPLNVFILKDL